MIKEIDKGELFCTINSGVKHEVSFLVYFADFDGRREIRDLRLSGNYRFARIESSTWDLEITPCGVWWGDEFREIFEFLYNHVLPDCRDTIEKKYDFAKF